MSSMISGMSTGVVQLTPGVISQQVITNLLNDQGSIATLQQQISTGNLVNQPSDNPAQIGNIMQLSAAVTRAGTYVTNAGDGLGWLATANSTMNQVISSLQQVRQTVLSISSTTLTSTPGGLQALADQVSSARQSLLNLANTKYSGQAIFAGTGNTTTAFDASGTYLGGGTAPTRTMAPGVQVAVAVTGDAVFGAGSTGLLGTAGVLDQIVSDIQTGTPASLAQAMGADLKNLDGAITTVQTQAAQLGAQYQRAQAMSQQATASQASLNKELSGVQSVNLAQAITNLQTQNNSYQTALWGASQLIQPSLVQFLG